MGARTRIHEGRRSGVVSVWAGSTRSRFRFGMWHYPVYVDTNVMAGRTGPAGNEGQFAGIVYMPATAENGFVPAPPQPVIIEHGWQ